MIHSMPEGTTEPQVFQLYADGEILPVTGFTVGIEVYDKNGTLVASPGTVEIVDGDAGKVKLTPTAANWSSSLSPYRVRWTVSNGPSMYKVPNGVQPDSWIVPKP